MRIALALLFWVQAGNTTTFSTRGLQRSGTTLMQTLLQACHLPPTQCRSSFPKTNNMGEGSPCWKHYRVYVDSFDPALQLGTDFYGPFGLVMPFNKENVINSRIVTIHDLDAMVGTTNETVYVVMIKGPVAWIHSDAAYHHVWDEMETSPYLWVNYVREWAYFVGKWVKLHLLSPDRVILIPYEQLLHSPWPTLQKIPQLSACQGEVMHQLYHGKIRQSRDSQFHFEQRFYLGCNFTRAFSQPLLDRIDAALLHMVSNLTWGELGYKRCHAGCFIPSESCKLHRMQP